MDFFKKYDLTTPKLLKIAGLILLAVVVVVVGFSIVSTFFGGSVGGTISAPMVSQKTVSSTGNYGNSMGYGSEDSVGLSTRNIATAPSPEIYNTGGTTGDNAEEFEVAEYNATIETRQIDKTCAMVAELKARDYVIFETASEYDERCNYVFKVKKANVAEILDIIKGMDPKYLTENVYTIKNLVEDYTSRIEILQKKLASIDDTLENAINAYDNITALATRVQDVESLAKIINSKISIIERLTQERVNINSQLEQIARAKAEQLDRLEYTYFTVSVWENKFVDAKELKDSWKESIKEFVININQVAQDITVNLAAFLFFVFQYAAYLLILILIAKYGWKLVKYIWRK